MTCEKRDRPAYMIMPPIRKTKIREEITAKIQSRLQGATKKYADKILMPQRYLAKSPSINRTAVILNGHLELPFKEIFLSPPLHYVNLISAALTS